MPVTWPLQVTNHLPTRLRWDCSSSYLTAEKAMAPHSSSTLAWKVPWVEEPWWATVHGSLRVGHDWATSLSLFTLLHWRRKRQPTPVFLPGESHGQRSLVGYSPWGRWVGHDCATSLSCVGEGNSNPFQYSCLESPRGRRTCWAAVYGVAQSLTRLMRLSSSSIL